MIIDFDQWIASAPLSVRISYRTLIPDMGGYIVRLHTLHIPIQKSVTKVSKINTEIIFQVTAVIVVVVFFLTRCPFFSVYLTTTLSCDYSNLTLLIFLFSFMVTINCMSIVSFEQHQMVYGIWYILYSIYHMFHLQCHIAYSRNDAKRYSIHLFELVRWFV